MTFEGSEPQTKHDVKEAFKLNSVTTNPQGIQVQVTFPPLKGVEQARSPQERFQAMVANQNPYTAVIVDNEGETHPPTGTASSGGSTSSTFSFNTNINGELRRHDAPGLRSERQFFPSNVHLSPLPEGRTIKAIRAGMEERTGEAKVVGFTLESIPLK